MALILSLETATPICSVALHHHGQLVAEEKSIVPQSTASQLAVLIHSLFKRSAFEMQQLEAVAVSAGPGSYTGLRIGVATAKGICFANSIPLIAINTLELMVSQVMMSEIVPHDALFCPMLDARRMEVYCLLTNSQGEVLEATQAKVIDASSFGELLGAKVVYFFGNGAAKCQQVIQHPNAKFIQHVHPNAQHMGLLSFQRFNAQAFENLGLFEPLYLKDFLIKKPN